MDTVAVKLKEILQLGLTVSFRPGKQILAGRVLVIVLSLLIYKLYAYFDVLTYLVLGKGGLLESPSHDRLIYLTACLIGHQVEVQVMDGSVFSGIFHATNAEDFGMFKNVLAKIIPSLMNLHSKLCIVVKMEF